jgi:hypothetical protein
MLPVLLLFCTIFTACVEDITVDKDLWSKIRNTAWVRDGDTKPTLGFYAPGKGPEARDYSFDPNNENNIPYFIFRQIYDQDYFYYEAEDSYEIYDDYIGYYHFKISIYGDKILWTDNDEMFKISVFDNGQKLTIKSNRYFREQNGTYTKVSSDPDFKFVDDENRIKLW